MSYEPCRNPNCPSYGKPHPNCKCFAEGGEVCFDRHMPDCEHYADGGPVEPLHPMATVESHALHSGLNGLLSEVGKHKEPEESYEKYLGTAKRGHSHFKHHMSSLLEKQKKEDRIEPDGERRESLKKHLDEVHMNPSKMLEVGGNIADVSPSHGAALAATSANAVNYLNSLKPMKTQNSPLDQIEPIDKYAEHAYHRQVDIANHPLMVAQHIRDGTVLPEDLKTIKTIYPNIHQNMVNHATDLLLKHKDSGISYKHRQGLSMLFEQNMDSTMAPASMQAILQANAPEIAPAGPKGQPKKASGVELKQLNLVDKMAQTPLDRLQAKNK